MTREKLFKIISENNQLILDTAIALEYYDKKNRRVKKKDWKDKNCFW